MQKEGGALVTILVASPGAGLDRREVGGCHYGHAAAAADRAGPRPERRRSEPETPGLVDFMTVQVSASSTMLQGSSATRRSVSNRRGHDIPKPGLTGACALPVFARLREHFAEPRTAAKVPSSTKVNSSSPECLCMGAAPARRRT